MRRCERRPIMTVDENIAVFEEQKEIEQKLTVKDDKISELMKGIEVSNTSESATQLYKKTYDELREEKELALEEIARTAMENA